MNPTLVAARAGLSRGRIELKQTLTTPGDLITFLIMTGGFLTARISTRHTHVPGTAFPLGTTTLVSVLALDVGMYGVLTMGDRLVYDREDGTLLRAKAIPNGMLGYLLGKVVNISGQIALAVAATLLAGAFLVTGLAIGSPGSWRSHTGLRRGGCRHPGPTRACAPDHADRPSGRAGSVRP